MHSSPAYVFIDQWKAKWKFDYSLKRLLYRQNELFSCTSTLIFVPPECSIRLCACFSIKYDREFHDCGSKALRISAHGIASSGAARCLANRRLSSDRCSSVKVIALGTSATLSQRSPASAIRSSALSPRAASSSCLRDIAEYFTSSRCDFTENPSDKSNSYISGFARTTRNPLSMLR